MRDWTTRIFCGGAFCTVVLSGLLVTGSRLDTTTSVVIGLLCGMVANLALDRRRP